MSDRDRLQSAQLPLYVTLSRLLQSEIRSGRWAPGRQIPTIAALSEQYGVARVTIRQALGELSSSGLIKAIQGKGTFVTDGGTGPKPFELESSWQNFLQALDGNVPETIETKAGVVLPPECGKARGLYRYMRRRHLRDGEPYSIIEIYLCQDVYKRAPSRFDGEMIIPNLKRFSRSPLKRMEQSFRIGIASLADARMLSIPPGAPTGDVTRLVFDKNGEVIYLGAARYRGDLVVFNASLDIS